MFYNIKNGNNKCSSPSGFIAKQYLIFFCIFVSGNGACSLGWVFSVVRVIVPILFGGTIKIIFENRYRTTDVYYSSSMFVGAFLDIAYK